MIVIAVFVVVNEAVLARLTHPGEPDPLLGGLVALCDTNPPSGRSSDAIGPRVRSEPASIHPYSRTA